MFGYCNDVIITEGMKVIALKNPTQFNMPYLFLTIQNQLQLQDNLIQKSHVWGIIIQKYP